MPSFPHSLVAVFSAVFVTVVSGNALMGVESPDSTFGHRFIGTAPDATLIEALPPTF